MNQARQDFVGYKHTERSQLIDIIRVEISALRPMGIATEMSVAMGLRPRRGVLIGTPLGTYVFAKARTPSDEQVDRWNDLWQRAESAGRDAAAAGQFGVIDPGCTIGNPRYMLDGCALRDFNTTAFFGEPGLSLLDDDEQAFLSRLIEFWNAHPDPDTCGVVNDNGTISEFTFTRKAG